MEPITYVTTNAYIGDAPWLFATTLRGSNDGGAWRLGGKLVFPVLGQELEFRPDPTVGPVQVTIAADGTITAVIPGQLIHPLGNQPAISTLVMVPGKSSAGPAPVGLASLVVHLPVSGNPVVFDSGGMVAITGVFLNMYISEKTSK